MTTYPIRLFGGRSLGVIYDSVGGTLSILNASVTLASVSTALQARWASAVATTAQTERGAFAGDNIAQAVGAILDAAPAWRTAVLAALATFAALNPSNDPESFVH
jgi:hypothetical protein